MIRGARVGTSCAAPSDPADATRPSPDPLPDWLNDNAATRTREGTRESPIPSTTVLGTVPMRCRGSAPSGPRDVTVFVYVLCRSEGGRSVRQGRVQLRANSNGAALSVSHLSKRFGDRFAFDDVSFEVGHGEVFGFLGPNGAGKTTTVRTLGTLIAPTSGEATVAGFPLSPENGVEIRRRISVMPEAPGLYLKLSVIENLRCFADLYEVAHARQRIDDVLSAVNLADRVNDACGGLSKGLRQRVALARALLPDPQVLFLDEPTSGLDPAAARDVHELIDGLRRRGVTVFLTTHRLEEAERLCDRVAILNTTLRTIGRPDELRDRLFRQTLAVRTAAPIASPELVFGNIPGLDSWRLDGSATYVLSVSDTAAAAPAVTRALVAADADVLSIAETHHSLEDVYLQLVADTQTAVTP